MSSPSAPSPQANPSRTKGILALSLPLILSFWFRSLVQWIDAVYASKLGDMGDASIAAIGLSAPFEFLMIACWVGSSNALTSLLSTAMERREDERVQQVLRTTRRLITGLGALFMAIAVGIWFLADHVGLEPDVAQQFKIYGTVLIAGYSVTIFWSVIPDSIVKAHHDMKTTMWAGIASTVLNVVLNTYFVFGLHWGIFGIAMASVLAKFGGLAYGIYRARILEAERLASLEAPVLGTFPNPTWNLVRLAVPASIAFVLMALEGFAFNGILARQENSADLLAAWTLLDRTARFLIMPVIAIGVATLPLIARLAGQRNPGRIRHELRDGLRYAIGFALLVATPLALFLGPLIVTELIDSPAAAEIARGGMYLIPIGILLGVPLFLMRPAFEGLQEPRPGLKLSALRSLILSVPLGLAGFKVAPHVGLQELQGLLLGGALASGITSFVALNWMRQTLTARFGTSSAPTAPPSVS